MKIVRAYTFCFLALVAACGFSGCATTSSGSYEQQMRAQQEEEKRKADWEQLNWAQKAGSYFVYITIEALGGLGSGGVGFRP